MKKNNKSASEESREKLGSNNGFKKWFNTKFVPTVAKLGNQRHLAAIRDAFGTMMPLIIAGSIGVLINAIVFGGAGSGYVSLLGLIAKAANPNLSWEAVGSLIGDTTNGWGQTSRICGLAFGHINTVTVGMMALWFSFLFGYFIAVSRGFNNAIIAGMVSTSGFLLSGLGEVAFFMDAKGLIGAIIFGIISTELMIALSKVRALNIKLPDGVPPAVGKSFAVFLPAALTLSIIGVLNITVLAPAIISGGLHVTGGSSLTLDANTFKAMFGQNRDTDALLNGGLLSGYTGYEDTINEMINKLNTKGSFEDMTAFSDWYKTLNDTNQSIVSTAMVILNTGSASSVTSIDSGAAITFAVTTATDGTKGMIAAFTYQKELLGPTQFGLSAAIYQFFTSWFMGFATGKGGLVLAVLFVFFVGFFWFFGVHGSNLMGGIFEPIFLMILGVNSTLVQGMGYDFAAATGQMGTFTKPFFDSFMYVGGSGSTLGLLIATFAVSKRQELKQIAKYCTPPGVFQINEPVIFGYPIILNPIYATPFIIVPVINVFVGWSFSPDGFMPEALTVKYSHVITPWTAPWFLNSMITTLDWKAIIPAMIVFGVAIVGYFPFVLLDNKLYFKKLKNTNPDQYNIEMKYYSDPEYKYGFVTNTKIEAIQLKGDSVVEVAHERLAFFSKFIKNEDKINDLKTKTLEKANAKKQEYYSKADAYKQKRDAQVPNLKPTWDAYKQKQAEKAKKKEIKLNG